MNVIHVLTGFSVENNYILKKYGKIYKIDLWNLLNNWNLNRYDEITTVFFVNDLREYESKKSG